MSSTEEIILKRVLDETGRASTSVNHYFQNFDLYNYSLYDQLKNIRQANIVYYIFFGLFLFAFFHRLEVKINHLVALILFILIVYYFIQKNYGDHVAFTKVNSEKLNFLNTLLMNSVRNWLIHNNTDEINVKPPLRESYLQYNPYIIDFYYNVREMSIYNIECYVDSLTHTNNMLGLLVQMRNGLENPFQDYKSAIEEYKKSVNAFKSLVFKSPSGKNADRKLNESIYTLQELLMAVLKEMEMICKRANKLNGLYTISMPDDALEMHTLIDGNPYGLKKCGFDQKYDTY
jgi:hypothetical protein